jgi:peptide/nickel transport system permease protein
MLRFALQEAARLALGLLGSVLVASAIAALASPQAWHATGPLLATTLERVLDFLRFSFGYSAISGRAVVDELGQRLPVTGLLVGAGAVIAVLLGAPLGLIFGIGSVRRAAGPLLQAVTSTPVFCAGLVLAFIAQHLFHWPVSMAGGANVGADANPTESFNTLLLPVLTVGMAGAGCVQLLIRRGLATSIKEPYRLGLRRLGLSKFEIDSTYVAPQILAALLTGLGQLMLALLSAAAVSEWVFGCPGAAVLFLKSVALGDWSMTAGVFLAFSAITMTAGFCGLLGANALTGQDLLP